MSEQNTRLAGVGYRYGARAPWVLQDVDLTLEPGAITRVIGANGSGKSTLLRILAGARRPTRGQITGHGHAGYVPGKFPELPFTAIGYLQHLGRIHGLTEQTALDRARIWLERFDATMFQNHPINDLSRGSAQKVGIIQALLAEPRLLVLDEAWTGLDAAAQDVLDDVVLDSARQGTEVVFVDHDPERLTAHVHAAYKFKAGTLLPAPITSAQPTALTVIDLTDAPDPWPGPGAGRRLPDGALRLQVDSADSDDLLREILSAHPKVHIRSIKESS